MTYQYQRSFIKAASELLLGLLLLLILHLLHLLYPLLLLHLLL